MFGSVCTRPTTSLLLLLLFLPVRGHSWTGTAAQLGLVSAASHGFFFRIVFFSCSVCVLLTWTEKGVGCGEKVSGLHVTEGYFRKALHGKNDLDFLNMELSHSHYTIFPCHVRGTSMHSNSGVGWAGLTHTPQPAGRLNHLLETTLCFSICYCRKALTLLEVCGIYWAQLWIEQMEECAQGRALTCTDNSEGLNLHQYTEEDGKHCCGKLTEVEGARLS